jgi:DnaD/phage-associated family protein
MNIEPYKSILFSDTLVPDIFISEHLPSMDGDYVKVYIYCLFLCKYNKQISIEELSKKLQIDEQKLKNAFTYLESVGIITRSKDDIVLADLKEKEINKLYRLKTTSTPEEAVSNSEKNKKRSETITSINNTYFQGVMPPSWYTDIDAWFDRYKFDEDVMYALFRHCSEHKVLTKSYIVKVADNWYNKNIRNYFDLEKYLEEYKKFTDIRGKISKKLKLGRNLTEYEDEYVEKWTMDYKYNFEVIDLALKKTTAKTNPNFKYIDAILTSWFEKGLRTREEIIAYEKSVKASSTKTNTKEIPAAQIPQHANFEQREYDDDSYGNFFSNVANDKKAGR